MTEAEKKYQEAVETLKSKAAELDVEIPEYMRMRQIIFDEIKDTEDFVKRYKESDSRIIAVIYNTAIVSIEKMIEAIPSRQNHK